MLGERGMFVCEFAGNPKPDILWYFNGKVIVSTKTVKIRTEEHKSILTIYPVEFEHFGVYLCKAISEAGICESRAKLVESSTPTLDMDSGVLEVKKIVQAKAETKKSRSKSRSSRESEATSTVESTVKSESTTEETSTFASSTTTTITTEVVQEFSSQETQVVEQKTSLIIQTHEDMTVEELQAESVQEIKHESYEEVVDISDIESLKYSVQVNEILQSMNATDFGPGEKPLRDLATIAYLVRHGISVNEITSFYHADQFPALQTPESQSALVLLLEREGHANIVSEVLTEESEVDEAFVASTAGFRAFMRMVEMKHATVEEIIAHFSPEDFVAQEWKLETADEKFEETHLIASTEVRTIETTTLEKTQSLEIKGLRKN